MICASESTNSGGIFDLPQKRARVEEIDAISQAPDFWDDPDRAQAIMQERGELLETIESIEQQAERLEEAELFLEMAQEAGEGAGGEAVDEALGLTEQVSKKVRGLERERMFSGEHDGHNAFVSINSGAGGTDSQDWAEMLLRMYTRYATAKGWKVGLTDRQDGQEAGIKSATLHVQGRNVFGWLKAENGVHRLVRISPYGKGRRETSFAAVRIVPEVDDDIDIDIDPSDLRIDTYRASGAGGQHVNRTESAVRITHDPTGVVVQCQNERSQHKNRATAMKMLRAQLYDRELQAREEAASQEYSQQRDVAFGSQIRNYVLHPYKQIKDLRTGHSVGNVDRILDGDLDEFIEAYLLMEGSEGAEESGA